MKRLFLTTVVVGLAAVIMSGCGGGGSGKSGQKNNPYLGSLPAILADYSLAKKADKEKIEKLESTGDINKMMKEAAKMEKEEKERDAKFEADLKAETEKIAGKDIPFTCSEEFKKMNCEVNSVKIELCDRSGFSMLAPIVAKNDFTLKYKDSDNNEYENIYFRVIAKDGSTIEKHSFYIAASAKWGNTKSFTKGQPLPFDGKDAKSYLVISKKPEKWVDFSSIEFITQEEFAKITIQ